MEMILVGKDDQREVRCDNCAWEGKASETESIKDPDQRLEPGQEVPVGECPKCCALSYLKDKEQPPPNTR